MLLELDDIKIRVNERIADSRQQKIFLGSMILLKNFVDTFLFKQILRFLYHSVNSIEVQW